MSVDASMELLIAALQQRLNAGKPVEFWLRDDDAVEPGTALDKLLELTQTYSVPLTLALIPAFTGDALQQRLVSAQQVAVAVHGWSHENHAPQGEKRQELGPHRAQLHVVAELTRGFKHLSDLYETQFVPILVPPWNRLSDTLVPELSAIGFRALSTFGDQAHACIAMINTHVDIIDWKGDQGGRSTHDLVIEIIAQVHTSQNTIGVLTHHLVHDDRAWEFLKQLFSATSQHPGVRWVASGELLQQACLPDPGLPQQQ